MKLETMRSIVHDTLVCFVAGAVLALGLTVLLFLTGLLFSGFESRNALVIVRGGLFVLGALELLVSAGMMLFNKDSKKVRNYKQWYRHFHVFGLVPVLLITAVPVIALGSFVDYLLYF